MKLWNLSPKTTALHVYMDYVIMGQLYTTAPDARYSSQGRLSGEDGVDHIPSYSLGRKVGAVAVPGAGAKPPPPYFKIMFFIVCSGQNHTLVQGGGCKRNFLFWVNF